MFTLNISPYVTGSSVILPVINETVGKQVNLFDRVYTDRHNYHDIISAVHQGLLERLIKLDSVSHPFLPSSMFVPPPKPHLEAKWTGNMVLPSSSTPARCVTTQDAYTDKFSLNVGKCSSNGGALSWYALEDLGVVNVTYNVTGKDGTAGVQVFLQNSQGFITGSTASSNTGQFFVEKTIQLDISKGYEIFVNIGKATGFGSSGITLTEANISITP